MVPFHSEKDFLNGISVRLFTGGHRGAGMATLTLFAGGTIIRTSSRSAFGFQDGEWERFTFDAVSESKDMRYGFSIEADDERIAFSRPGGQIEFRQHHFDDLAGVLDSLLFRNGLPTQPISPAFRRYLDRQIYWGIFLKGYSFLQLVHLCDAIGRIREHYGDLDRVLSVGAGSAYQEAFVAGRLPQIRVEATDRQPRPCEHPFPNLKFGILDVLAGPGNPDYDLVISIDCLQYVSDYRTAFKNQASRVAIGGFLYISVPFASPAEQEEDEKLRALDQNPPRNFSFEDLKGLFEDNGIEVLHACNMFFCDLVHPLRSLVGAIDHAILDASSGEFARLSLLDISDRRIASRTQAEGIRFLGRKRATGTTRMWLTER